MAVLEGTATVGLADQVQATMERAVSAWLAAAGTSSDGVVLEGRLRTGRALINRLEVGFGRDAAA
ncbi:MAG: hypothetical protein ACYDAC_12825, partial [Candidatus Dormibacteria bacterium]